MENAFDLEPDFRFKAFKKKLFNLQKLNLMAFV